MKPMTIAEIREKLSVAQDLSENELDSLQTDTRVGVQRLLKIWEKRQDRLRQLRNQYQQMNVFEDDLRLSGRRHIAGIDEAGRGPLAGPVVAASVILRHDAVIPGINDSKQLSSAKRDDLFDRICESADAFGIGIVSAREIDEINIYQAAKKAMVLAVKKMKIQPDYLLIDAMELPLDVQQRSLIKGDARSNSIAAASILAKVTRDRLMRHLDHVYPGYNFAAHKGYGTKAHLEAIRKLGICPEHRMTFAPLKTLENA
ncbi:ribonuclease HII [Sporolactobacillus sp. CPB3-1]|uniref:Ribonuclease HII n=1 Tax=Sporolactobacillus mangiferae TaxID=2940498 RepID=A0ABT0M7N7_9BACL|nr:ribonuclease HII [Sporolactobacillus mangiferae]MCL1630882.1 ribonuclease HII [Sporolactobacillus mangiferae]